MSIFDKHIKLAKVFDITALNNRATARKSVKRIEKSWTNAVVLDFEDIDFASRSFLDELNAYLPHIDKEVKKTNMSPTVKRMDKLVQKPKDRSKTTYNNSKADSEQELLTF